MVEMAKAGESANLEESFDKLLISLGWKGFNEDGRDIVPDLDVAAVVKRKDGSRDVFCFAQKGDRNGPAYIMMSEDEGVAGKDTRPIDEERQEKCSVFNLEPYDFIDLVAWDWGAVKTGSGARFDKAQSRIELKTFGTQTSTHNVTLDCGDLKGNANVSFIARIDNTNEMGPQVINMSRSCLLEAAPTTTEEMASVLTEGLTL